MDYSKKHSLELRIEFIMLLEMFDFCMIDFNGGLKKCITLLTSTQTVSEKLRKLFSSTYFIYELIDL